MQAATLEKLTEAMAAWIYGSKMDGVSFAHHFFDRDADDPVVGSFAGGGIGDGGRRERVSDLVKVEHTMIEIEFPWLRFQLIENLKSLSNIEYQDRDWIKRSHQDNAAFDEMDYIIHFLYDDTELAENPQDYIGKILQNNNEVESLKKLTASLDVIFSKYGFNLDGPDYIRLPEWAQVVESAKTALGMIR